MNETKRKLYEIVDTVIEYNEIHADDKIEVELRLLKDNCCIDLWDWENVNAPQILSQYQAQLERLNPDAVKAILQQKKDAATDQSARP